MITPQDAVQMQASALYHAVMEVRERRSLSLRATAAEAGVPPMVLVRLKEWIEPTAPQRRKLEAWLARQG